MAESAPRLCSKHGLTVQGKCPLCQAEQKSSTRRYQQDSRRIGARQRGYTRTWQRVRQLKMSETPTCEHCSGRGIIRVAVLVHHIDQNPHNNDMANLMSLCRQCHDEVHGKGMAIPNPSCKVTLVAGPPGSGKSTWVEAQRKPTDTVIDLDVIKSHLARVPIYQAGDEWIHPALIERNRMLSELPIGSHAWFIVSAPRATDRKDWQDKLGAHAVVLEVDASICKDRIDNDTRRPDHVKKQHKIAVDRWWRQYVSRREDEIVR